MSRPIAVSNLGPGIFTYKQTYFVCFFVFLRIQVSSFSFTNLLHILMEMLFALQPTGSSRDFSQIKGKRFSEIFGTAIHFCFKRKV